MKKRHRGGQPGNLNALKHGFYSPFLSPEEISFIWNVVNMKGVDPTIAVIRVKLEAALQRYPSNHRLLEDAAKLITKKRLAEEPMDAFDARQYRAWALGALENVHSFSPAPPDPAPQTRSPAKRSKACRAQTALQNKTRLARLKSRRDTNRICQSRTPEQDESSVI